MLKEWNGLPESMKNESVRKYYDILDQKRASLIIKRIFDIVISLTALLILSPIFVILCIMIKLDSKGPVMFRQTRVTQYGKEFRIFKFRTMVADAEKIGAQVTIKNDKRVTRIGRYIRKFRLDEIPQLLNIISGDMSFVGTRPEVVRYVERYTDEMMASLLLPAGVTSETSIEFKDEEKILTNAADTDRTYVEVILPEKMKINLRYIKEFSFYRDIKTMIKTVLVIFGL